MNQVTREMIDSRLEEIIRNSWERHSTHFPALQQSDVDRVLQAVGIQGALSSRGGKRLRALLLIRTASTFAPDTATIQEEEHWSALLDLACAIEIFQTAALIHDDLIDDADSRRGAPSAHRALSRFTQHDSQGNGLALMLGDLLATLSIRTAFEATQHLPHSAEIFQAFLTMHDQVELGQIMDVSMETLSIDQLVQAQDSIRSTYINKTASYTTTAPLYLGFLASGIDDATHYTDALHEAGDNLGVAFQIHDDLLDLLSDPQHTGKPIGGDIVEGKRTLLLAHALEKAETEDCKILASIFADDYHRTARDVDIVRNIFIESGAIDSCINEVEEMWQYSAHKIADLCIKVGITAQRTQELIHMCQAFVS